MGAKPAYRTFTPVPNRVQDGSEDILPAAVLSGAPMELQARTVRYVPRVFSRFHRTNIEIESTKSLSLRPNREISEQSGGAWIGTFSRRVIVGKTR